MSGRFDRSFELKTNDPERRSLRVSVAGTVKPMPAFVKRISNAEIARAAENGPFLVWPSAHPVVPVDAGERFSISLRLRPKVPGQTGQLELAGDVGPSYKLRREENGDGYWLDIAIESPAKSFSQVIPVKLVSAPPETFNVRLDVNVVADNVVATPRELKIEAVSLQGLKSGGRQVARLGIRKNAGTMRLKSIATTLRFLRLEQQTIVEGSNYLIRIFVDSDRGLKAGRYNGSITAETDDGKRIEVPVSISLVVN
ncbi:MAG TPA: hypothetical protein VKM94_02610 [Blastocatellia bacterium]|nr:hypothetical protein [Blastocatellia bacterium]